MRSLRCCYGHTDIHARRCLLRQNECGASIVEYAIIVALIAVVLTTIIGLVGDQIMAVFESAIDTLDQATGTDGGSSGGAPDGDHGDNHHGDDHGGRRDRD